MTPKELRRLIGAMPAHNAFADRFETLYWPDNGWLYDQQRHWITWLADHEERGTTDAYRVYANLQAPGMILWLAASSGVLEGKCREALLYMATRVRPGRDPATEHGYITCGALRHVLTWTLIRQHLEKRQ